MRRLKQILRGRSEGRLGQLLVESVLIILSVVVGLMANEWRVSQAQEEDARTALQAIQRELESNYGQMQKLLPYHREMKVALDALVPKALGPSRQDLTFVELQTAMPQGFSTILVKHDAWKLANFTGTIQHVDFGLAGYLSELYSRQDFYQSKVDMVGQNIYIAGNIDPGNLASSVMATSLLITDMVLLEEKLVEQYPKALERLKPYTE